MLLIQKYHKCKLHKAFQIKIIHTIIIPYLFFFFLPIVLFQIDSFGVCFADCKDGCLLSNIMALAVLDLDAQRPKKRCLVSFFQKTMNQLFKINPWTLWGEQHPTPVLLQRALQLLCDQIGDGYCMSGNSNCKLVLAYFPNRKPPLFLRKIHSFIIHCYFQIFWIYLNSVEHLFDLLSISSLVNPTVLNDVRYSYDITVLQQWWPMNEGQLRRSLACSV